MKITAVETILLQIPYDIGGGPMAIAGHPATGLNILLVRIRTDAGITGWGEAFGHAVAPATKLVIDTMIAPLLIGRDPTDITALMFEINRNLHLFGRNGPLVYGVSGVDIALWDIAAKRAGLPLHALLGGAVRHEVPVYASLLRYGEAGALEKNVRRAAEQGYRYIKLHEIDPKLVELSREVLGPDIALMVDTNCPWTPSEARAMAKRLKPLDLYWLEEPIWPPEDHASMARLRDEGVPLSAGENAGGLHDFKRMFELGAVDIAQPSVTKIGGITEVLKINALAESFGVRVVPHCAYFGPGYLASLHLAACLKEEAPFERLYMNLETSPFLPFTEPRHGTTAVPQEPGLGCDPDDALIARYRVA
jgi:L-alanine-DL-glutamate epimerase-like enolase superfamily enzyme